MCAGMQNYINGQILGTKTESDIVSFTQLKYRSDSGACPGQMQCVPRPCIAIL